MPVINSIDEAKEAARGYQNSSEYSTICVDSEGGIYLNNHPKSLEEKLKSEKLKMFQVRPEIKEEAVKPKTKKTNE